MQKQLMRNTRNVLPQEIPWMFLFLIVVGNLLSGCGLGMSDMYRNPVEQDEDVRSLHVLMPTFPGVSDKYWFNTYGDTLNLKEKIVLIDFWDYTCVNCIQTLPYLKEWYARYEKLGLVIIGVHSPEFEFAKQKENILNAICQFGIRYPVVMDNDFQIWNEFGNRYWPAEYIFDSEGVLRSVHFGEGNYGATEETIQRLLRDINPKVVLPPVMGPVRPTDTPGACCYRTTAETYLGYERGTIANTSSSEREHDYEYSAPASIAEDKCYLTGKWDVENQYVRYAGKPGEGSLTINYIAKGAELVIRTDASFLKSADPLTVYILQDGKPLLPDARGDDVQVDSSGRTFIVVESARMYSLTMNAAYGRHVLTLLPTSDAFSAYAFTFITACQADSD
ncbi:MAG TPA: redoxin domain-containing protein [Candidatus Kryptonia bacterium]